MESIKISYQIDRCTVDVERIYQGPKPIKELLLELMKERAAACLKT